ncbi:hypothetical protein BG005_004828 [Podila minutissima]|nr:hypothetical protein BG005_004828 [Podila minutissima]
MSDSERPFIISGEYNETGAYDYTTRSRMFLDHYTNGVITDLQYGDGQMFALLQLGSRDRWDDPHNMTLVHMPFTAPLNRSSTELQITRTQWNTECELRMTYGTTLAVASGKLYYLCQNTDKATAESFTYLYIHDSKTGATQGPWRFDGSYRDLRLVYGSTVQDEGEEGPKFGIVKSQRGHVATDLRSAGHARLKLFSVLDNAIVPGNLNAYEFSRPCDESCSMGNSAQRMVIIVLTVVVPGMIGICFLIRHRTIKKRRLREAALGVPSMRMATHRPADEDDMELPPYTERDQNSKAGPDDSIYSIAKAVRINNEGEVNGELITLMNSNPHPSSIREAKWTVVSTSAINTSDL